MTSKDLLGVPSRRPYFACVRACISLSLFFKDSRPPGRAGVGHADEHSVPMLDRNAAFLMLDRHQYFLTRTRGQARPVERSLLCCVSALASVLRVSDVGTVQQFCRQDAPPLLAALSTTHLPPYTDAVKHRRDGQQASSVVYFVQKKYHACFDADAMTAPRERVGACVAMDRDRHSRPHGFGRSSRACTSRVLLSEQTAEDCVGLPHLGHEGKVEVDNR